MRQVSPFAIQAVEKVAVINGNLGINNSYDWAFNQIHILDKINDLVSNIYAFISIDHKAFKIY